MILESKPLHKKKKRLARKTKDQGSDGSPQVWRYSDSLAVYFCLGNNKAGEGEKNHMIFLFNMHNNVVMRQLGMVN